MNPNAKAFLDMIAVSEGTKGKGSDGYNVVVGGSLFYDYSDHPRRLVRLNKNLASTAAGRYQILARNYDAYKGKLSLPDFSPDSQDAIALQMIREKGALIDVMDGRFDIAVHKCRRIWASFPGAGYGQRENRIEKLRAAYLKAGGTIAEDGP